MRKFGIFTFTVGLATGAAVVYAWVVRGDGFTSEAWERAFLDGAWAGFVAGATVGVGATFGPRPALPPRKCIRALLGMLVSSIVGALVARLFPREWSAADQAIHEALAERGLFLGSGIGLAVGTAVEIVRIYFSRRKPASR